MIDERTKTTIKENVQLAYALKETNPKAFWRKVANKLQADMRMTNLIEVNGTNGKKLPRRSLP